METQWQRQTASMQVFISKDQQRDIRFRAKQQTWSLASYFRDLRIPVNAIIEPESQNSVLHTLAHSGPATHLSELCELLKSQSTVQNYWKRVNMCNRQSFTPLHIAVQADRLDCVEVLIDAGCFLFIQGRVGNLFVKPVGMTENSRMIKYLEQAETRERERLDIARRKLFVLKAHEQHWGIWSRVPVVMMREVFSYLVSK